MRPARAHQPTRVGPCRMRHCVQRYGECKANALVGRCPDDRNDPRRVLCQHGDHTDKARPEKVRRADCIPSRSDQRGRCSRSQRATFPHCKRATLQQSTCNVTAIMLPHASSTCNVQQFDNQHATWILRDRWSAAADREAICAGNRPMGHGDRCRYIAAPYVRVKCDGQRQRRVRT